MHAIIARQLGVKGRSEEPSLTGSHNLPTWQCSDRLDIRTDRFNPWSADEDPW
jgi:hypothetical protein